LSAKRPQKGPSKVSVELRWHEPGKTLACTYSGKVTPEDLTGPLEKIRKHFDDAASPLNVIVDWRQATDYPFFADFMFQGLKLIRHKNMGWIVLVGEDRTLKLWVDLFANISNFRYKIVSTFEEATEFLRTSVI
jgi:hypothetical protein